LIQEFTFFLNLVSFLEVDLKTKACALFILMDPKKRWHSDPGLRAHLDTDEDSLTPGKLFGKRKFHSTGSILENPPICLSWVPWKKKPLFQDDTLLQKDKDKRFMRQASWQSKADYTKWSL